MTTVDDILIKLRQLGSKENLTGMQKFGISGTGMYGVRVPDIRKLAKEIGKDHDLALELWKTQVHEARILATMIDNASIVTGAQLEEWVNGLDSWDLCDHFCGNLMVNTKFTENKVMRWINSDKEYVKRAGFALIAELAVKDKKSGDDKFIHYLDLIRAAEPDDRNFVKKAVNWALRQIGKRNASLNREAIKIAELLFASTNRTLRWIGSDALRELKSSGVQKKLEKANKRIKIV